ncbi:MAG: glycosyltransferase family 87 protein [Acidobacteriota bacterium]
MKQAAHWITEKRLKVYPKVMFAVMMVVTVVFFHGAKNGVDSLGRPLGYDFITYYAASKMALAGHAAEAYSVPAIAAVEHAIVPATADKFAWYYPSTFYLLIVPLAWMPYYVALFVFVGLGLAAYLLVLRRVIRGPEAMWCLAGFSGLWLNLLQGQNGFLTAAIAGAALLAMEEHPAMAGVLVGMMAIKPHLALLFPVALIAARMWKTLAVAAVTTVVFVGLGTWALGVATLKACVGSLPTARMYLEDGSLPWAKMPTVFAMLRTAHVPVTAAYVVHGVVALAAVVAVWRVWSRTADWMLRGAVLMSATFLVSPYFFDYDMAWLAFPIAWLALVGMRDGWMRGEREVLALVWVLPMLMQPLAKEIVVQPSVLAIVAMVWMVVRRVDRGTHLASQESGLELAA